MVRVICAHLGELVVRLSVPNEPASDPWVRFGDVSSNRCVGVGDVVRAGSTNMVIQQSDSMEDRLESARSVLRGNSRHHSTLIRRWMAGPLVWRLSGVTYPTAVAATHGRFVGQDAYLQNCVAQMAVLANEIRGGDRAVELGCGLGGNLIALAPRLGSGLGLDVNSFFLRHARRLARTHGANNLRFRTVRTDGGFDDSTPFDVGLSIGVFERLPETTVRANVASLAAHVRPGGRLLLYFLSDAARDSPLVNRLGPEAYVFWTESNARAVVQSIPGLAVRKFRPWFGIGPAIGVAPAFLLVVDRVDAHRLDALAPSAEIGRERGTSSRPDRST